MAKRTKKYIPSPKYNPVVQNKRIEKTQIELKKLSQTITLITESNERHYQLLGNFARHDIKNIIINLNSILELYSDQIKSDISTAIQINIDSLTAVISNFSQLIPHSDSSKFKFKDLLIATRILVTPLFDAPKINCVIEYDKDNETEINLPFQAVLQMINNLVVNAIKAVESNDNEKVIKLISYIESGNLHIDVKDNGCTVPEENRNKIFDFAFSTTGGSGIGLNHAKYFCEKFNGKISLSLEKDKETNKSFNVVIPIL